MPGRQRADPRVQGEGKTSSVSEESHLQPCIRLTVQETAQVLHRTPVVLRELILALPSRAVAFHASLGKWCIKEVVGHLSEEDGRDFVGRIEMMLSHTEPHLDLNDQQKLAQERHDCDKDILELLDEFAVV